MLSQMVQGSLLLSADSMFHLLAIKKGSRTEAERKQNGRMERKTKSETQQQRHYSLRQTWATMLSHIQPCSDIGRHECGVDLIWLDPSGLRAIIKLRSCMRSGLLGLEV
jgi:hypothetical protein